MARENLSDPAREGLRRYLDGKGIILGVGIVVTADEEIVQLRAEKAELLEACERLLKVGDHPTSSAFEEALEGVRAMVAKHRKTRGVVDGP